MQASRLGNCLQQRQQSGSLCSSSMPARLTQNNSAARPAAVQNAKIPMQKGQKRGRERLVARMGIKFVESFESTLELEEVPKKALTQLLSNQTFCKQVATETQQEPGTELEFADILFQPVPWSLTTKKGMPQEYEKLHEDPDYVLINVPPNFLFQAKIFKPSRLCAFYRKK